jgi:hypothetical protein
MRPQARLLLMKPKVGFAHGISTHLLSDLLILSIFIHNRAIANGVHYMHTLFAHLAS